MNQGMQVYKKGQGMITRSVAGCLVFAFALFGCYSLYEYPAQEGTWWGMSLISVEALDIDMNWGFVVSTLVALALGVADYTFVFNHPKSADFLIEVEAELKKVSWPAKHEYLNSSFVVILSVVILSLWLVFSDTVIGFVLSRLGY